MKVIHILFLPLVVLFFSCNTDKIPTINILKIDGFVWNKKEACTLIYSESDTLSGNIKYRGGFSHRYNKHSFSLELDKIYSFGGMPQNDDWILNANYIDKTFMRHKISYDLFREMNSKNIASKCMYVNVSINHTYEGLYLLMQEINGGLVFLQKQDSLSMLFKDPPIFFKERVVSIKDTVNYYQQKFPKIEVSDKTYYLKQFKDFLFNTTDAEFAKDIAKWVDIENVIDWHIILLYSNNSDGIMKNFYLYKINQATPFRFAIWDYDHSFGRDGDNEHNLMERELDCNRSILLERLSKITEIGYMPKLKKRWFELRKTKIISVENFEKHISSNHEKIKNEIEDNFSKWPVNSSWYFDDNTYEQELDLMREFVKMRIKQLDAYFLQQ